MRVVQLLWVMVLSTAIASAACGGAVQYGSFLDGHETDQKRMAADAADKLKQMYPPEHNPVQLAHPAKDSFGQGFISRLRGFGYVVLEAPDADVDGHRRVGYAVDQVEGMQLLRLKLVVDDRTLSRAYVSQSDGLKPVGSWSSVHGAK